MLLDERVAAIEEKKCLHGRKCSRCRKCFRRRGCFRSKTSIWGGGGVLFSLNNSIEKICIRNQGLYPDAHGVLANEGYDSEIGRVVDHDLFHYNESIVPIWVIVSSLYTVMDSAK